MQWSLTWWLLRSWVGHLVRMEADDLEEKAEAEQHQGHRKGHNWDGRTMWLHKWFGIIVPAPHPRITGKTRSFQWLRYTSNRETAWVETGDRYESSLELTTSSVTMSVYCTADNWPPTGYLRGEHLRTRKLSLSNKNGCK